VARLLLGQRPRLGELPGEHALFWDAVRSLPRRQPNGTGLWRAGCGGTRTSGSEVQAGEADRPRGRHRAPARPYALSWLSCFRRLGVRWDRDAGRWFGFVLLAGALVCFNRL
jgi:hypothetical protein